MKKLLVLVCLSTGTVHGQMYTDFNKAVEVDRQTAWERLWYAGEYGRDPGKPGLVPHIGASPARQAQLLAKIRLARYNRDAEMARLAGVRAEEYSWRIKEAYAHEERMAEIRARTPVPAVVATPVVAAPVVVVPPVAIYPPK